MWPYNIQISRENPKSLGKSGFAGGKIPWIASRWMKSIFKDRSNSKKSYYILTVAEGRKCFLLNVARIFRKGKMNKVFQNYTLYRAMGIGHFFCTGEKFLQRVFLHKLLIVNGYLKNYFDSDNGGHPSKILCARSVLSFQCKFPLNSFMLIVWN